MDVDRVAKSDFMRCHHRRHAACVDLQPGRDHHCRGRLGDRFMPGRRRPLGPANVGVTVERGIGFLENTDNLSISYCI